MRVLAVLIVSLIVGPAWGAEPAPAASKEKPLRVLILTGRNNHDWKRTTPVMQKTYEASGRFSVDVVADPTTLTAAKVAECDVLVSNWNNFPKLQERVWGEAAEKAVIEFVRRGGGMVFIHAGTCAFYDWDDFQKLAGGNWGRGTYHGPGNESVVVHAIAEDHPIVKGMPPFVTADEIWRNVVWHPDAKVLIRGNSLDPKSKPARDGGDPLAVATSLDKGRGYFLVLGHGPREMENVGWKTLLLRGTEWAATGKVTIPIPEDWPSPPSANQ